MHRIKNQPQAAWCHCYFKDVCCTHVSLCPCLHPVRYRGAQGGALSPKPLYVIIHVISSGKHVIITFWSYQVCLDVGSFAQGSVSMLADNDVSARPARLPSTCLMRCCLSALWLTDLLHPHPHLLMCLCVWPFCLHAHAKKKKNVMGLSV